MSKDKEHFILDIISGSFSSINEAAQKYKVSERTIYRWLSEHDVISSVLPAISGTVLLALPIIFKSLINSCLNNNVKSQRLFFSFLSKSLPQLLHSLDSEEPYQNVITEAGEFDIKNMSQKQLRFLIADTNLLFAKARKELHTLQDTLKKHNIKY